MIGFVMVGTGNLQRAMAFYDALFASIGINRLFEVPNVAAWGVNWNRPLFGVTQATEANPFIASPSSVTGLRQRTRLRVRDLHAKALSLGAIDAGAPDVRGQDGEQAFFCAYVRDLDDNRLCFYRVGPEEA